MGHNGCDGSQAGPWVLGTASPPSLEQTLGGGSITPKHGSGYPGPSPEGGGCHILTLG